MNWDQIEGKWKELSGKAQQQWGELTDNDIQEAKGDRRELAGKIQNRYGVTKEEAERQLAAAATALLNDSGASRLRDSADRSPLPGYQALLSSDAEPDVRAAVEAIAKP